MRTAAICTVSLALLLGLESCSTTDSSEVIGQAYVAPASLNLRPDLTDKNNTVAVLEHGERVGIIDIRRRFIKVRTSTGKEGWVDSIQLLSPEQMEQIRRDAQQALALPSEGAATVFEALNVHLEPNRQSPAFVRIAEGGSVVVLGHKVAPKISGPPKPSLFVAERLQPESRRSRRERQARSANRFLPSPPPPPKAPRNWQELSRERIEPGTESIADAKARRDEEAAEKKIADLRKPVVLEDWTLIRTKDNQCGWVLSRNLVMSIPDEVAQYAEGKRITSYFDLGAVNDDVKGVKHQWLWTTAADIEPFDFDAWRVFIWNRRRHRYETSYRQRDVEGHFPVRVDPAGANAQARTFALIIKDEDGKFQNREYSFDGVRVHLTGTKDYQPGAPNGEPKPGPLDTKKLQAKVPHDGWLARKWNNFKRRFGSR